MVRLVFRPYTQIWRSICTSEPLRASTRVSSGFTLFRHSSPSFGSQQLCSYSNPSEDIRIGRWCTREGSHLRSLSLRARVWHPNTRVDVRLLGPCFKTGRKETNSLEYYDATTKELQQHQGRFDWKQQRSKLKWEHTNALLSWNNHFQSHHRTQVLT